MTLAPAVGRFYARRRVAEGAVVAHLRWHGAPLLTLALMVGAFYAPFLLSGTAQWDAIEVHYSGQRYFGEAIRAGRLPFWTPYLFSGFPFLADLQVGAWYPLNWPFMLLGVTPDTMNAELLLHGLIACAGAYALAYRLTGNRPGATAAGMFYGLSGYFVGHSQHVGMVQTAAWLPWLVLLMDALATSVTPRRLALAAVVGAALALPGHFQTALYTGVFTTLWATLDTLWARSWPRARWLALGLTAVAAWGAALAAIMIAPGLELVRQSVRTQLDGTQVGLGYFHVEDLLTLIQPDHYGVLLDSNYTGPGDVTQHYFYAGILLVPLALLGMTSLKALRTALALGLPFVWYALGPGTGLFDLVAQWPGFRSVELPMHGWFLPALGLALLGGAGVAALRRSLPWPALTILFVLLFVDVLTFNSLMNRLTYARSTAEDLYLAPLRAFQAQLDPSARRIYGPPMASIVYRNHALQSRVETTYGYNPLELTRYAEYVDSAQENPRLVAGLAATHYLDGTGIVEPLPDTLPLAFFAGRVTWLPDQASSRAALDHFDPRVETIAIGQPIDLGPDSGASVELLRRAEDVLVLHYRSPTPNLLRMALPIYPGWHAEHDSQELTTLPVDHAFIGVVVPAGEGDIRLWYAPRYFWLGAAASIVAFIAVLFGLTNRFGLTR